MRRYRHLHEVYPRPYNNGHEGGHEVDLVHGYQRERHQWSGSAQSSWSSGGSEDDTGRRCDAAMAATAPTSRSTLKISRGAENPREATGVALSPHVSCSPISFYSAHPSALTSGAAEITTATVSTPSPPKAFYDGPSLRDSIPALLARLASAATPSPSRAPTSARSFELAAKEDTCTKDAASLLAQPIVVPWWSGFRHSDLLGGAVSTAGHVRTTKNAASNNSSRWSSEEILPGTARPGRTQAGRYKVRQPNEKNKAHQCVIASAEVQSAASDAPPSAAAVVSANTQQRHVGTRPTRYVVMQRPAAAHILSHAAEVSAQIGATTPIPESAERRAAELTPRYRSAASSNSSAGRTCDVSSVSVESNNTSSSLHASRRPRTSSWRRKPNCFNSAVEVVPETKPGVDREAVGVSATPDSFVKAGKESPRTVSGQPLQPQGVLSSSMSSTSSVRQQQTSPSRMRGLFAFALSNRSGRRRSGNGGAGVEYSSLNTSRVGAKTFPECVEGVPSHVTNLRPLEQRRSRTIASPCLLQQPMKGVLTPSRGILHPDACVVSVDPSAAAVQQAGDPLVLRHTIDYLLSKARRLEQENQRLWWQTHSWNPHRSIEPHESHSVASPLAHRGGCKPSSPATTVASIPAVVPSPRVTSAQTQRPPEPLPRVFVKRQTRLSQAAGCSVSSTSTSSVSQVTPRRSSGGGKRAEAEEHGSATLAPHLCTATVSPPSAAADTPITGRTQWTQTAATSAAPHTEVGAQGRPATRDAATDTTEHRSPLHYELVNTEEAAGASTEGLQHVSFSSHADVSAQTELATPPAAALLRTLDTCHRALHYRLQGTEGGDSRGIAAATPTASTVHSNHNIDSERSVGAMSTHAKLLRSFPIQQQRRGLSSCSSHVHVTGTNHANESFVSHSRSPTYSKQVQTARICLPSLDEVGNVGGRRGDGDTLMTSTADGSASVLSTERTAVIELHTSTSYTQNTVRRLREYCKSLEATRQQLRRRLSRSLSNSRASAVVAPSCMQSLPSRSHSHSQLPLHSPCSTDLALSRPFFTSEYVDPEVDATLHDVEETTALETMIVLHEDGAGSITKRVLDSSNSCISGSTARSSSPQSQRPAATMTSSLPSQSQTAVAESVALWVHRCSRRHSGPRKLQYSLPHHQRDTQSTEILTEEPHAHQYSSSLRSDGTNSYSTPVVHLSRPTRSVSASSWNISSSHIHLADIAPLAPSLSSSPLKESLSVGRFVVPPTTPFSEGDTKQLPPPQQQQQQPHSRQIEVGTSVLIPLEGPTALGQRTEPQSGVTSSTARVSSKINSQRFVVKEVSKFVSPKKDEIHNQGKSSRSSANSEVLRLGKQSTSSVLADVAATPLWDPTRHSSRSASSVVLSTPTAASAAVAPRVGNPFVTPVTTSGIEAGVRGASIENAHRPHCIAASLDTVVASASLSPLTAPEPDSEEPPSPIVTQVQQHNCSPLHHLRLDAHLIRCDDGGNGDQNDLYNANLHVNGPTLPASRIPCDSEENNDDRSKRSTTKTFLDEERREASTVLSARTCLVAVQLPGMENDVVSPDGADSFHSREAAASPRSSAERAAGFLLPAQLKESLLLQSQHPTSKRLISPSPPREAASNGNAQNPRDGSTDLTATSTESTSPHAAMDSTSLRRCLALPQHRPPVASPRVIVMSKDKDSCSSARSSLSRSLHSLCSTFSDGDDDNGCYWDAENEDEALRYTEEL
ncbi:hypothetical protein NXY56_006457 [Leishmania guyanensis]